MEKNGRYSEILEIEKNIIGQRIGKVANQPKLVSIRLGEKKRRMVVTASKKRCSFQSTQAMSMMMGQGIGKRLIIVIQCYTTTTNRGTFWTEGSMQFLINPSSVEDDGTIIEK